MRSNFHAIKATIKKINNYSTQLSGISSYTSGSIRLNIIKVVNSIVSAFAIIVGQVRTQRVKISNALNNAKVFMIGHFNDNRINIQNELREKLYMTSSTNREDGNIKVNTTLYDNIVSMGIPLEQQVRIANETSGNALMQGYVQNDVHILNSEVETNTYVTSLIENTNKMKILNPSVNGSAFYFTKLAELTGTMNDYYNKTLNATGRTRI